MPTDALNTPSMASDKSLKVYDSIGEWRRTRRHHHQQQSRHYCHAKKVNEYHDSPPFIKNGEASGLGARSLKGSQQNSRSAQQFSSMTNQMPDDAAVRYHSQAVLAASSASELPADDGGSIIVINKSVASAPSLTRLQNHGHDPSPDYRRLPRLSNPASSSEGHQVVRCADDDAPLRVARSNSDILIIRSAADHDEYQQTQSLADEDDTKAAKAGIARPSAVSKSRIATRRLQQQDHDNHNKKVTLSSQDKHRRNTSDNGMMIHHGRRKGLHWDPMSRFRSKNDDISVFRRSASTVFCDSGYLPSSRQSLRLVPNTDKATHCHSASPKQNKPDQQAQW